jgi:hypothetical protein
MTYVPNTIGIPTHGVDWWHHGPRIGKRKLKSPIKLPQDEERKIGGRKIKRGGRTIGGPITSVHSAPITPCQMV